MRTDDLPTFAALGPDDVVTYLGALGWSAAPDQPVWTEGNAQVWVHPETTIELLVPLRQQFRDYAVLVADLCATLAKEHGTDLHTVAGAIAAVSYDMIRLRVVSPEGVDTLGLADAVTLLRESRMLISAVAASAVEPRPTHPKARPPVVRSYLDSLEMAQTERGSFVVAIRSPVDVPQEEETVTELPFAAEMAAPADDEVGGPELTPRSMTLGLYDAVEAANNAVPLLQERNYERFDEVVHAGVSSNLYAALSELSRVGSATVELSVGCSPRIPLEDDVREKLTRPQPIRSGLRGWYQEAAERLRSLTDLSPMRISGKVTDLHRDSAALTGWAIVQAVVAGTSRNVRVILTPADHQVALDAYRSRRDLTFVGAARKQGRQLLVEAPSNVRVADH